MIVSPGSEETPGGVSDHPLNNNPESQWNTYFRDNEVLLQIDKDVRYVMNKSDEYSLIQIVR